MKHVLSKVSHPGWIKNFDTEQEACKELLLHICNMCLKDGGVLDWDGKKMYWADHPLDVNNIYDLLCTPCGAEYMYEMET